MVFDTFVFGLERSQSSLTGECMPVEKYADLLEEKGTPILELRNTCLMVGSSKLILYINARTTVGRW